MEQIVQVVADISVAAIVQVVAVPTVLECKAVLHKVATALVAVETVVVVAYSLTEMMDLDLKDSRLKAVLVVAVAIVTAYPFFLPLIRKHQSLPLCAS